MRRYLVPAFLGLLVLAACEGARNNTSWSSRKAGTAIVPPLTKAPADSAKSKAASDSSATATADSASKDSEAKH